MEREEVWLDRLKSADARANRIENELAAARAALAEHKKRIAEKDFDGSSRCGYCHGVGACPRCWGRAGITKLEAALAEKGAALRELFALWNDRPRGFVAAQEKAGRLTAVIERLRALLEKP